MIVKQPEGTYSTAPEGTFPAICVDEIDLGMVTSSFGGETNERHMVRIVWQLGEDDEKGKPYQIKQDYTASLHEKSNLRKVLQSWRGKAFTDNELFGFDLETVVGTGCLISVVHNAGRKGGTFANVGSVMKLPKGMAAPMARDYMRVKDRPEQSGPVSQPRKRTPEEEPPEYAHGITDDDVPFNRRSPLAGASMFSWSSDERLSWGEV